MDAISITAFWFHPQQRISPDRAIYDTHWILLFVKEPWGTSGILSPKSTLLVVLQGSSMANFPRIPAQADRPTEPPLITQQGLFSSHIKHHNLRNVQTSSIKEPQPCDFAAGPFQAKHSAPSCAGKPLPLQSPSPWQSHILSISMQQSCCSDVHSTGFSIFLFSVQSRLLVTLLRSKSRF